MPSVFDKLNLKAQTEIVVLDAPESFEPELAALRGVTVRRDLAAVREVAFFLAFVMTQKQVDAASKAVAKKAAGDAIVWLAYPKGSSKRYTCDFNRDSGWTVLGESGFEPVRMIAIDEDWSALRFRRAEYMGKMTRAAERAISAEGKKRAKAPAKKPAAKK